MSIAQNLAINPGGTLPQAFPDWSELKAAYRFFGQEGVSFKQVLTPHLERTRTACRGGGEYLIIEDTTLLDYSHHPATADLGRIGDGGRGFELHSALAVRVEGWTLEQRPEGTIIGLFGQSCVTPRGTPSGESLRQRLSRPRKSQRWAESFKEAGCPPRESQWIYMADRESDFYEPMQLCQQHEVDFIIRGYQNRRLAEGAVRLLSVRMLARSRPESFEAAAGFGPEMLALLEKKLGTPKGGWTNQNVIIATARLRGFLARKHVPGWQTIWRGWQRLIWMQHGIETLIHC